MNPLEPGNDPGAEPLFDEVRATLRAYEGPALVRKRPTTSRRLRPIFIMALVAVMCSLIAAGIVMRSEGGSRSAVALKSVHLRPLPAGPQKLVGAGGAASTEYVSLQEMIKDSPVVFVGTVSAIGRIEAIEPRTSENPIALVAHRVRFSVERSLRGDPVAVIDITSLDIGNDASFSAQVGRKYLIFAEQRNLGSQAVSRLVPTGYMQGVYVVTGTDSATSESTGNATSLEDIAKRVESASHS